MQSRRLTWVLIVIVLFLTMGIGPLSTLITDWMWFKSVGYDSVLVTVVGVRSVLGLIGGLVTFLVITGSARAATRVTGPNARMPADLRNNPIGQILARTPLNSLATGIGLLAALLGALMVSTWWEQVLQLVYGGAFGFRDPVWDLDAQFYVFILPLVEMVRSALAALVVLAGVVAMGIYVSQGAIQVQLAQVDGQMVAKGLDLHPSARRHLATLVAVLLALMAVGAYLQRYSLMAEQSGLIAGPSYSELWGTIPLLTLQAIALAIAAFVAFVGIDRMSLPWVLGSGVLVVVSSAVTAVYPDLVQRFSVDPNELNREGPQIIDHVEATRFAFELDKVDERPLSGEADLSLQDIADNDLTIKNVRLWDHSPLLATFSQVQEIRTYYTFQSVDNDRYMIDGELRQIMLSPRELEVEALPQQARTWVNETMTYTHGYGVALGPVNEVNPQGLPRLWVQDLPPVVKHADDLAIDRPEIYFGEAMRHPALVLTDNPEFDYPAGDENKYTRYAGDGGVPLSGVARALFSIRLSSTDLLFSSDVNQGSRVLLYRDIRERVGRIAPFLRYDRDPYLVVADGRMVWVLDAYTTSRNFPYSHAIPGLGNYMRNSVKVTIDAYDGTLRFYRMDDADPIADSWVAAFPGLFRPSSDIPDSLRAHLRYPIDHFAVQSMLFGTYHMQDHQIFYNREDEWEVPTIDGNRMAPYYTVMRLPGEQVEEFILMLPFTPKNKPNLAAWMVARSDGDSYGELRVYKFPKDKMVYGPEMIVARINQDDAISEKMSLWNQQGSQVQMGTLLVIPVEESLIYVQPLYLRAESGSIPELKRVIVAYQNQIAMGANLEEGLQQIFGDGRGADIARVAPDVVRPPTAGESPPVDMSASQAALIDSAVGLYRDADAAMRSGDWARYGHSIERLGETLQVLHSGSELPVVPAPVAPEPPALVEP